MNSSNLEIKILDPGKDEAEWLRLVSGLDQAHKDVFLFPGYAKVYEKIYNARAGLFCIKTQAGLALHTFLRRPINNLPFFSSLNINKELFDIITPEYSGPVISCPEKVKKDMQEVLWSEFNRFCLDQNMIAEFGRLNPYYNTDQEFLNFIHAQANRKIIYVDLRISDKEHWAGFSKGNKSSIKKAEKQGITIKRSASKSDIDAFYRVYAQTMKRNQAAEFYYFSPEFFYDLFEQLKGNISLFHAVYKDTVVAASVFLHAGDYIHYYFSGSDSDFLELCPNNLLIFEALGWAKKEGYKIMSLGGGYHNSGQDSLFKFKASFSDRRIDFCTYKRIHDQAFYHELVKAYADFNKRETGTLENESFFPFYRK